MMKKLIKDTLSLVVITIVAGLCLSFVHELTADTISAAEEEERAASYREVFPDAEDFKPLADFGFDGVDVPSDNGVTVEDALFAVDGSGNAIGCVISARSANGYGGAITLSLGENSEGVITGMKVTSMSESPGFGSHCQDKDFQDQFKGLSGEISYTGSGKTQPNEIDMISGATFTTSAVTEAVNRALEAAEYLGMGGGGK